MRWAAKRRARGSADEVHVSGRRRRAKKDICTLAIVRLFLLVKPWLQGRFYCCCDGSELSLSRRVVDVTMILHAKNA